MSYSVWVYVVPATAIATEEELVSRIRTVVADFAPREPLAALVAPLPAPAAGWSFTIAASGRAGLPCEDFGELLGENLGTLTKVLHDDHTGTYWFSHIANGRRFDLGSIGPYLRGDVAAITIDYPQRGYTNRELRSLHGKPEHELSAREFAAIAEYRNAVSIGFAMFYRTDVWYLRALNAETAWEVSRRASRERIQVTNDWIPCIGPTTDPDLEKLAAWLSGDPAAPEPKSIFDADPVEPVENLYERVPLCNLDTLILRDEGRPHRARILPSPKDFIMIASRGLASYRVHTPYVYDPGTTTVCQTSSADPADRIEYEITNAHCVGVNHNGHSLYHATIEGRVGQRVIFRTGVRVLADASGRDGHLILDMTAPTAG